MFTKGQYVRVTFPVSGMEAVGHVTNYPRVIEHGDERDDSIDWDQVGVQFDYPIKGFAYIPAERVRAK